MSLNIHAAVASVRVTRRMFAAVLTTGSGVGLGAISDFVILAIVSRSLGPSGFGIYGTYVTLMALIAGVSDCGLSVILAKHIAQNHHLAARRQVAHDPVLTLIFVAKLSVAVMLFLVGLAVFVRSARVVQSVEAPILLAGALVGAAALSMSTWITGSLQGAQRYGTIALYTIGLSVAKLIVVASLWASGALSPITALLAASFVNIAYLCVGFALVSRPSLHRVDGAAARDLWQSLPWVAAWSILGVAIPRADILLVRAIADSTQTGQYLAATRLCSVLTLLNAATTIILLPKVSHLGTTGELHRFLRVWGLASLCAAVAILVPLEFLAAPLVALVFGSAYHQSVILFQIIVVGAFLELALTPFAFAALAIRRPAAMTLSHGVRLLTILVLGSALARAFGVIGVAVAVAASAFVALGGLALFVATRSADGFTAEVQPYTL